MLEIAQLKMKLKSERNRRKEVESQRDKMATHTKMELFTEYLRGIIAEKTINTAEINQLERVREQRKITKKDFMIAIKGLGYNEKTFDKMKSFEDVATSADECIVCYEPPKDHLIMPCNHVALCGECYEESYPSPHKDQVCPLCDNEIKDIRQVYYF